MVPASETNLCPYTTSRLCATLREFCSPFETAWVATLSEARRGLEKAHGSHTTLTVTTKDAGISRAKPLAWSFYIFLLHFRRLSQTRWWVYSPQKGAEDS